MLAELGDLKVKVKDIINEAPGFFKSYAAGLMPKAMKDVLDMPVRGDTKQLSNRAADAKAAQMFGLGKQADDEEDSTDNVAQSKIEVPPSSRARPKSQATAPSDAPSGAAPKTEPEVPYNLSDEKLSSNERIAVKTPAGMMYKYPNGRWYQIPTTGAPTPVPSAHFATLDSYANNDGYIEPIPAPPKPSPKR